MVWVALGMVLVVLESIASPMEPHEEEEEGGGEGGGGRGGGGQYPGPPCRTIPRTSKTILGQAEPSRTIPKTTRAIPRTTSAIPKDHYTRKIITTIPKDHQHHQTLGLPAHHQEPPEPSPGMASRGQQALIDHPPLLPFWASFTASLQDWPKASLAGGWEMYSKNREAKSCWRLGFLII